MLPKQWLVQSGTDEYHGMAGKVCDEVVVPRIVSRRPLAVLPVREGYVRVIVDPAV
jgi:hypothetical protein